MATIFDGTALNRAVQNTLATADLPAGHTNAIVGTVDASGVGLIVTLQREEFGATWQLQGLVRHDWTTNENDLGGRLIASW